MAEELVRRTRATERIYRLLFPPAYRSFRGRRWINIALRTAHLLGVAGVGGGFLYAAPRECWMPYLALTVGSGFALLLLEVWSNAVWLIQVCGIAMLVKIALLACWKFFPGDEAWLLAIAVVLSGISSHAPRDVRHFSIFHGRRVDAL